jgi:uncharacterized membrane protein
MSDQSKEQSKEWVTPKSLLTILEIVVMGVMVVWVFAFMRADLTRHDNEIKENINQIKENRSRLNTVDINQAVTQEQYRQIIDKIDELGRKLDEQR